MAGKYDLSTFTAEAWGICAFDGLSEVQKRNRQTLTIRNRLCYHDPRHAGYYEARAQSQKTSRRLIKLEGSNAGRWRLEAAGHQHNAALAFTREQADLSGLVDHSHEVWERIFGDAHAETVDPLSADGLRENLAEIETDDPLDGYTPFEASVLKRLDRFLDFLEVQFGDVQAVASDDD